MQVSLNYFLIFKKNLTWELEKQNIYVRLMFKLD
jgi:hypothetical protein